MSLNRLNAYRLAVAISFCVLMSNSQATSAAGKSWTIEERQDKLMQDINEGQKTKQLTPKEAKKLREGLSDVARKKKKFLAKSNGHAPLDASQKAELEADLNKVSSDVRKVELEKRVQK